MENQNQLREERNQLPRPDYRDLLSKIDEELNGESGGKIFSLKKDSNNGRLRLIIDIHAFAFQIAKAKDIRLPLSKDETLIFYPAKTTIKTPSPPRHNTFTNMRSRRVHVGNGIETIALPINFACLWYRL